MASAYTTKAQVKVRRGIATSDTSLDTTIDEIIAGVSDAFDNHVGYSIAQESVVEYHDGMSHVSALTLSRTPSEDAADRAAMTVEESGTVLVVDVDFFIGAHPSRVLWRLDGAGNQGRFLWVSGTRNIKVEFLSQWKVTPADIELAAAEESSRYFANLNTTGAAGDARLGIVSHSPIDVGASISFAVDEMSLSTRAVLDRYRRERFV